MNNDSQAVIIVSGLPRSGTSMMMRILQAGGVRVVIDGIRSADEDNPFGYFELEAAKKVRADASFLDHSRGQAVKMIYRLLYDLPDHHQYRVIFMRRNLREVVASQDKMLQRSGVDSQPTAEKLVQLFRRDFSTAENWLRRKNNVKTLFVDYNQLLSGNPRPQLESISKFLDRRLDLDAMVGIIDPALYRNRLDQQIA